ncbi:hypothetical protein E2C01_070488 [Portunus trituberculatus]|uniref:Uncharacterized protein n=1 Tax=Portunus trituberculatus TaxID=210409 RepID=A0A5B7I5J8_PORTR|nr:hypothetical protein [Portunus trituberculatus]
MPTAQSSTRRGSVSNNQCQCLLASSRVITQTINKLTTSASGDPEPGGNGCKTPPRKKKQGVVPTVI